MNRQVWIARNIEITPEMDKVFDWYEKCYSNTKDVEPFSAAWLTKVINFHKSNPINEELAKEMHNRQFRFNLGEE